MSRVVGFIVASIPRLVLSAILLFPGAGSLYYMSKIGVNNGEYNFIPFTIWIVSFATSFGGLWLTWRSFSDDTRGSG